VSKEFDDDTAWVPLLSGADLAAQVTDGVVVPLTVAGEPTAPTEIVIPEQEPDYQIGGTCVVCQHSDAHLSPEEAGDAAGCQHNGCMCLTAVWV
jgi:phenylpyruvate tautomerase PptA (4-oxalocrotonate tautomerase family)